jgi:heptose-I-phosphate ethanolaminephosphotransferase
MLIEHYNAIPYSILDIVYGIIGNFLIISFPFLFLKKTLTKHIRLYFIIIAVIIGVFNLSAMIHAIHYQAVISQGAIAVMFETTSQEAFEFLKIVPGLYWFIATILVLLPVIYAFSVTSVVIKRKSMLITYIILGSTFTVNAVIQKNFNNKLRYDSQLEKASIYMDIKKIAYYYREKQKLKELTLNRNSFKFNVKEKNEYNENRTIVIIIGESLSKYHMSLYGYKRDTNPLLKELDSLLIFRNVISSATQTRESIIRILTTANIENEKAFFNTGSIITLARDLGY